MNLFPRKPKDMEQTMKKTYEDLRIEYEEGDPSSLAVWVVGCLIFWLCLLGYFIWR